MSEPLVVKLLSDARVVAGYVIDNGIALPADVIQTLDSAPANASDGEVDVAGVVAAYNTLAHIIAPATPRDIVQLVASGTDRLMASRKLIIQMLFIAAVSLTGFVALSLSSYVNDPQYGDIFAASGLPLLVNELFFLFAAGLGASFWILMESHNELRNTDRTAMQRASKWLQFLTSSQIWLRFILGLIAGLILATIIDHSSATGSPDAVKHATGRYTAAAMALVGGFSARAVFNLMYRIALAVEGLVSDHGSPAPRSRSAPNPEPAATVEAVSAPRPEPQPRSKPASEPEPEPPSEPEPAMAGPAAH